MVEHTVTIKSYSEKYRGSFIQFAERAWPGRSRRKTHDAYLRWKFKGPKIGEMDTLLLAIKDGNEVVGQVGLIPATIVIDQQAHAALWVCEFMVDANARGLGIGTKLIRTATERSTNENIVILGSDPTPASAAVHDKVGFKHVNSAFRMLWPIKLTGILEKATPKALRPLIPALSSLGYPFSILLRRRVVFASPSETNVRIITNNEVAQLVAKREKLLNTPYIRHDLAHLNWRSTVTEGFTNNVRNITSGSGSYMIFEVDQKKQIYIFDWYAETESEFIAMLQHVHKVGLAENIHTIMALANSESEIMRLRRLGFLKMSTPFDVIYYPNQALNISDISQFFYRIDDSDGRI